MTEVRGKLSSQPAALNPLWKPAWSVADYLRISRDTVYRWARIGHLPSKRDGRTVLVDYNEALRLRDGTHDCTTCGAPPRADGIPRSQRPCPGVRMS